jgi:hypothetical protein
MNERIRRLHERFYDSDPAWINGTAQFGSLVRKFLRPDMVILNLGAGPGTGSLHFDRDVSSANFIPGAWRSGGAPIPQ